MGGHILPSHLLAWSSGSSRTCYWIEGCQVRLGQSSFAWRLREFGKQSEDPSFLLIEGIKERNHVDESVCHLQDSAFQVSLGREGAVPVWVGMGWLAIKSGEVPAHRVALADRILVIVDDHDSRQA